MKVTLINGSPRGKKATSLIFLEVLAELLRKEKKDGSLRINTVAVDVKSEAATSTETLRAIAGSDTVIFSFPLYAYTVSAAMTRLMEDYYTFHTAGEKTQRLYAIVNCAFPVPDINREALRVMKCFAERCGMEWRFGIGIGGGPVVAMTKNVPLVAAKLRKAYRTIARDITEGGTGDLPDMYIKPVIPKAVMLRVKDSKWAKKFMAKQE